MSLHVTFREAEPRDANRIASLHADSLFNRLGFWQERLSNPAPNQLVMLAEHDDELAGFICAFGDEDVLWGSLIDNLHVAAAHTRKGVGTQLMASAGEWLCTHYATSRVYLWVLEANAPARQFYEQLGGINVGTRHRLDAGGGYAQNCRYVWQLPQALQLPRASLFSGDSRASTHPSSRHRA